MYASDEVREGLASLSRSVEKGKKALAELRSGVKKSGSATFLLQMNFKVGAEKMASAIAESVSPRHNNDKEVGQLKELIFGGVSAKGAAVKGTTFQFDCNNNGVTVSVDGKQQGNVPSEGLGKAFCDVYLDDKGVSPSLKNSCLENCCAP